MTECKFYNPDFIILSSLASFYIPCVILLVVNYKIIKAFLQRNRGSSKSRNRRRKKRKVSDDSIISMELQMSSVGNFFNTLSRGAATWDR